MFIVQEIWISQWIHLCSKFCEFCQRKAEEEEEVLQRRRVQEMLERQQRAKEYLQRAKIARQRMLMKVAVQHIEPKDSQCMRIVQTMVNE